MMGCAPNIVRVQSRAKTAIMVRAGLRDSKETA
jgi:hypothetical protein